MMVVLSTIVLSKAAMYWSFNVHFVQTVMKSKILSAVQLLN